MARAPPIRTFVEGSSLGHLPSRASSSSGGSCSVADGGGEQEETILDGEEGVARRGCRRRRSERSRLTRRSTYSTDCGGCIPGTD